MKKFITTSFSIISSLTLLFLFSFSFVSADTVTSTFVTQSTQGYNYLNYTPQSTTYTQATSNVPLTNCPAGEQIVYNIGGPICMIVYPAGSTLPPGCTASEAYDILSQECQPELHWSYQLPNQPLTSSQAALLSQSTGQVVSPANQGWILCTEKDNYGCTGAGDWIWNSPTPPPPGGPPNTVDPYQDCAAATAIQQGSTNVLMLTSSGNGVTDGSTVAGSTVIHNSFFQGALNNACSSAPYNPGPLVNNFGGTTFGPNCRSSLAPSAGDASLPLCSTFGSSTGGSSSSSSSSASQNRITSVTDAATKTYNAIVGSTQKVVQNAISTYMQATGLAGRSAGPTTPVANPACYQFTKTLQNGSIDPEVALLRTALIADGDLSSQASAGGQVALTDFDSTVETAVVAFQEKYASDILTPLGLTTGTGIVATNTRAELNKLCLVPSQTTTSSLPVPTITGVQGFDKSTNTYTTGDKVLANTYVVLYGSFLASGNGVLIDGRFVNVSYESKTQINIPITGLVLGSHTVNVNELGKISINSFTIVNPSTTMPPPPVSNITLSPSSGPSGIDVTIIGNFPLLNQVSFGTVEQNAYYYATNGTQIYFIVPYLGNNGFFSGTPLPNGQYPVTVVNATGTSTAIFTVTGSNTNQTSGQKQTGSTNTSGSTANTSTDSSSTSNQTANVSSSSSSCYQFNQTLSLGSVGNDVLALRQALVSDGDLSQNQNLNIFDLTLHNAVTSFQEKYANDILTPLGLTTGTGIVATNTRAELNTLCLVNNSTIAQSSQVFSCLCTNGTPVCTDDTGKKVSLSLAGVTATQVCPITNVYCKCTSSGASCTDQNNNPTPPPPDYMCQPASIPSGETCDCVNGQLSGCVDTNGSTVPPPTGFSCTQSGGNNYGCDGSGQCVAQSGGPYSDSSCDNSCSNQSPGGADSYGCDLSGECVVESGGPYSDSSCNNDCPIYGESF